MKSNIKKRILAVVLCMVLVLSTGISTMADGEVAVGTTSTPENAASQEPAAASVEGEAVGTEQEPADGSADQDKATETQEEIPTETDTPENTDVPNTDENSVSGVTELVGGNTAQEGTPEQETEAGNGITEQETETVSEATELKQEFTDENGNVVQRVTANLPEGAFQASASEITMEVNYLDEATENHLKDLMTKALPENDILGDYILYDIKFKVNGEVTEPKKEITITFEGSGLHIEDTKKANVFYLDPADPEVQDDKDEIVEIIQKNEMMETLQNAGQSVENIDDYDLSEISVNVDGVAEKIQMEGRTSTIYGCYVEETPEPVQTLTYEDDDVIVNVDAYTENAIPTGAALKVVPIKANDTETEAQYKEVEEQLNKKAENEEYDIAGFLAYDICFLDEEGKEVEPNGDVKVTIEYKYEILPDKVEEDKGIDVTVMHLEEDGKGDVSQVVDMVADSTKDATVETTDDVKVKKAEFVTDSFSVYTITWTRSGENAGTVKFHYVNEEGYGIEGYSGKGSINGKETVSLTDDEYLATIPGYTHKLTTIDSYDNTISVWQIMRYNDKFYYNSYSNEWKGSGNKTYDVYFVYERSSGGGSTGEITEKGLISDKEVSVVNENTRTYEVELSAKATGREMGTAAKGASIVLVLDSSASMGGSGISAIQTAAKNFVTAAKGASSISEIAVVWYNGTEGRDTMSENTSAQGFKKLNTQANVTQINNFINTASASGGTPMGDALKRANEILKDASNSNKYVLFFTDGMPGYSSNSGLNCKTANNAVNYANTIKKANTEIYTVGYKLSGSFTWTEGHSATSTNNHGSHYTTTSAEGFLKNKIASDAKHAYTTSDASGLSDIFESIAGQLGDPYVINADEIVDVIDSRFELTEKSKETLIKQFGTDFSIKENEDGTTTLTWKGEAAKILNELSGRWSAKFEIQAKADFVGGNVIPTNGSSSGIYYKDGTSDKEQKFPQPSVNVKLLAPEVGNNEVTVKQGDMILSTGFPKALAPTFNVLELDNQTRLSYEELEIGGLTEEELIRLNNGESITRDYKYPGTADVIGYFEFSYAPSVETPAANVNDHEAVIIGNKAEVYELTAKFVPNTVDDRKNQLKDIEEPNTDTSIGGTPTTEVSAKGAYIVNITDPTGGTENKKLESDKNASVVSEADRTFKIDLTAHTTGREEGQAAKGASIVLVLDKSGSMEEDPDEVENPKKLSDIQDAAKAFVDNAAKDSPLSEIAVVWYSGTEGSNTVENNTKPQGFKQLNTTENITTINNFITTGVSANGGTPMGDALEKANEILEDASNDTKYVLFFTDGMPGYYGGGNPLDCKTANNAVYYATAIKNSGTEIYTVGYMLKDTDIIEWMPGHSRTSTENNKHGYWVSTGWNKGYWAYQHDVRTTGENFLANYIATDTEHAKTTDNPDGLKDIFEELAGQMGNPYSIQPEKIVDIIDSRFELTAESETALKEQYGNELSIKKNNDGTTTLTWTGASAKILNVIDGGWGVSFNVQAKKDFVGGNAIPTNGASSGIYVEGSTPKYFPQPSVNVKLLTPEVGNEEITLYKGDLIESSGFSGELAETFDVLELDNSTKLFYADLGIKELSPKDFQVLNGGSVIRRDYAYPGTTDIVGHFEFSYAPTEKPGGDVTDHDAIIIGNRVEVYELTVKFVPNTVSEREIQIPNVEMPDTNTSIGGTPVTELSDKGEYVVNVLDKWFIVKQSSSEDTNGNHPLLPDAEFKLSPAAVVDGLKQATYYGKTDANGILHWYNDDKFSTGIELSDIVYDTYILEETKAPTGYVMSTEKWIVVINETGTTISSNGKPIEAGSIDTDEANGTAYYFENTPAYALPSTGGPGIFLYIIGGILLMMAGTLILYKNKNREVLEN